MDFYRQQANELLSLQSSEVNGDIGGDQPDPETYFNCVVENGTLDGLASVVFPPCSFTYLDSGNGLV